jgi:hypothetical protein
MIIKPGDDSYNAIATAFAKEGKPRQMHINGVLYIRQENDDSIEFLAADAPNKSIAENYAQTSFAQEPTLIPPLNLGDGVETPAKGKRSRSKAE